MEKISIKSFGMYLMSALISCLLIATVVTMCSSCVDNVHKEKDFDGILVPEESYLVSNDSYESWDYCEFYINNVIDTKMSTTANGDGVYWAIYTDLDAEFDNAVISMGEETFTLLLEALDAIQDVEPYSQEWKEICDEYEFVILYKDKTNVLIPIDKD